MRLTNLHLTQFRCYAEVRVDIPSAGIRIVGDNATGKTSLLEAVGMLATTRSFRGAQDRDLVRWDSGQEYGLAPFGRVEAVVETRDGQNELGIGIQLTDDGESVASKRFELDGRPTTAHKMVGHLTTVSFAPEDVQLAIGPPAERRRSLDILISQIDRAYMQHLVRYSRVLRQRNSLLKSFARDRVRHTAVPAVTQLTYWDEQLVAEGGYLIASRARVLAALNMAMEERSAQITAGGTFGLTYLSRTDARVAALAQEESANDAVVQANAQFHEDLERLREDEFRRGVTLTGPHRDDVRFELGDRSLARFGSRGQQRLGVLALKLAEADVIAATTEDSPVFLLDDILSELDQTHRSLLLDAVSHHGSQVILTSAERDVGHGGELSGLGVYIAGARSEAKSQETPDRD